MFVNSTRGPAPAPGSGSGLGLRAPASGLRLQVVGREVLLPRPANGAHPVVRDTPERCPRRHAAVRVALLRVVDESAGFADPLLLGDGLAAHGGEVSDGCTRR